MWSYNCKSKIYSFAHKDNYVVVGCVDGWFSLFNAVDGLLWSKKLTATYYRGPFTDVNILSVDIDDKHVLVGTDFTDGKIYLYTIDGELLWYRQFITIVGCWERPDDVTYTHIGHDKVYVGSEWINSFLHVHDLSGNLIQEKKYDGSFKAVDELDGRLIVGTTENLYIGDKKFRLSVERLKLSKYIVLSNSSGLYVVDYDGYIKWSYGGENPLFTVDDEIILYDHKLRYLSLEDGGILREIEVEKPVYMEKHDDIIILGYEGMVKYVDDDGRVNKLLDVEGTPFYLGNYIASIKDNKISFYEISM